jgi:hypothetical protein
MVCKIAAGPLVCPSFVCRVKLHLVVVEHKSDALPLICSQASATVLAFITRAIALEDPDTFSLEGSISSSVLAEFVQVLIRAGTTRIPPYVTMHVGPKKSSTWTISPHYMRKASYLRFDKESNASAFVEVLYQRCLCK